jgi:hypothetical protein
MVASFFANSLGSRSSGGYFGGIGGGVSNRVWLKPLEGKGEGEGEVWEQTGI